MGFEKLFDLLEKVWDSIWPFEVLDSYQGGVVLRFGKPHRDIEAGFHWVWPLAERVVAIEVVPTVFNLATQAMVTRDGKSIAIGIIMTISVTNPRKALLEVVDVKAALQDMAYGAVGRVVNAHTQEEIMQEGFERKLLDEIRKRSGDYGIKIHRAQIADLVPVRALRLINSQ